MGRFSRFTERIAVPLLGCTITFVVLLVIFCGVTYLYGFGLFVHWFERLLQ